MNDFTKINLLKSYPSLLYSIVGGLIAYDHVMNDDVVYYNIYTTQSYTLIKVALLLLGVILFLMICCINIHAHLMTSR